MSDRDLTFNLTPERSDGLRGICFGLAGFLPAGRFGSFARSQVKPWVWLGHAMPDLETIGLYHLGHSATRSQTDLQVQS